MGAIVPNAREHALDHVLGRIAIPQVPGDIATERVVVLPEQPLKGGFVAGTDLRDPILGEG